MVHASFALILAPFSMSIVTCLSRKRAALPPAHAADYKRPGFYHKPRLKRSFQKAISGSLIPNKLSSACNFGTTPRIHLMIDCYVEEKLQALIDQQFLDQDALHKLPAMNEETLSSNCWLNHSWPTTQTPKVLKKFSAAFCRYDLFAFREGLTTYDLLTQFFQRQAPSKELEDRQNYWQERLVEVYPERKAQQLATV